jgi:hypothetical protein
MLFRLDKLRQLIYKTALITLPIIAVALPVKAQWFESGAFTNMMMQPSYDRIMKRNHQIIFGKDAVLGTPHPEPSQSQAPIASTIAPTIAKPSMPAAIAANYPPNRRAEAERLFTEILSGYRQLEARLNIPTNDVAGAVAAFLSGNYMAYQDVDLPDQNFQALVSQMRRVLGSNPAFAKASGIEKQQMYEQMAILGTFMALTRDALKKQPNPEIAASMKQAAKRNLEQFLNTDADRVNITSTGLVLQ